MRRIRPVIRDHPFLLDACSVGGLAAWAVLVWFDRVPSPFSALSAADAGEMQAIYLALAGAAAIVAGFAGVVVVFGVTAGGHRFRRLRAQAGKPLMRSWMSSCVSGFVATALSIAAALLVVLHLSHMAAFAFVMAAIVLTHAAARLLWMLRELMRVAVASDVEKTDQDERVSLSNVLRAS